MVLVLVRQEDRVDGRRVDADRLQALREIARAEARVDQDADALALDERGVAGAARPQDAEAQAHTTSIRTLGESTFPRSSTKRTDIWIARFGRPYGIG